MLVHLNSHTFHTTRRRCGGSQAIARPRLWAGLLAGCAVLACTGVVCTDLPAPLLDVDPEAVTGGFADGTQNHTSQESSGPEAAESTPLAQTGSDEQAASPAEPAPSPVRPEPSPAQPSPTPSPAPDPSPDPSPAPVPSEGDGTVIAPPPDVPQTQLKPIARWNVVPFQRINADGVLNCGVVAFSKYGISGVRFTVHGQGYRGPSPVEVTQMTLNEQSGTWEYWTPIYGADFTGDGPVTVEAEVFGHDGGFRDQHTDGGGVGLDALPLVVNPAGSLAQPQVWVSPSGNDGAGAVDDPARPFATIGRAIDAIRKHRASLGLGETGDGGVVRLMPGTHVCSDGGATGAVQCENEWLTVTTAAGGTAENTTLLSGGTLPVRKLAIRGITLQGAGVFAMSYNERSQCTVWADGCHIVGAGRGITTAHPLSSEYARLYYTDCSISELHQATSGSLLCRNLSISRISDDAFQNVPMVVNCIVDDLDPLGTGAHADLWQHAGGNPHNKLDDNIIVYNLVGTRLTYQSLFIRADINSPPSMAQGMAFVNVYSEMLPHSHGWAGWGRWVDHMLWWHCTFAGKGMGFMSESYQGAAKVPCRMTNVSVKGCDFAFFGDGGADIEWGDFDSNHFAGGDVAVGVNFTQGDRRVDEAGIPHGDSPLVDRLDAVVPVDANNNLRGARADVGAFER